ncbi:MAG: DUF1127 domain-containing protein [Roseobacter sp.]
MQSINISTLSTHLGPQGVIKGVVTRLAVWRTRRALASLDAAALKDIGISPQAAASEAEKGFWDVPHTWKYR